MNGQASMPRFARKEDLPATDLDQETVLMNLATGAYSGLEGPARRIWELLETPRTLGELVASLVIEFDVEEEACRAEVQGFLRSLEQEGLLRVG